MVETGAAIALGPLTQAHAQTVIAWRYEPPYALDRGQLMDARHDGHPIASTESLQ